MNDYALELQNITKTFPGVKALDNVSFSLKQASIHGFIGENGAGKSTLMKILYGIYSPDCGKIIIKGKQTKMESPSHAISLGVALIPQEIDPVRNLTVKANIFLGREPRNILGILDEKKMYNDALTLLQEFNLTGVNPNDLMENISLGQSQIISIITAYSMNANVIIMDEPTSALTSKEINNLYEVIRKLQREGHSVIYISHKLQELYDLCDTVTVIRDGQTITTEPIENLKKDELIKMMVGREMSEFYARTEEHDIGEEVLKVENLTATGVDNISFSLRKGEILGFYGLIGAGRSELMETLFGYRNIKSGKIELNGKPIHIKSPKDAIDNKLAFVTEDRKVTGLLLSLTVRNNIMMPNLNRVIRHGIINDKLAIEIANKQIIDFKIKSYSPNQLVSDLSGGNQQKVLLARWLLTNPDIIILDEPTRGIDVGAKGEIHHIISTLASQGKSVIVVSSEIPEILSLADRIIVMHEGEKITELDYKDADSEKIMDTIIEHQLQKDKNR